MDKKEWYADGLRFSCTQCGDCCTGPPGYVWVDETEAKNIADYLNISIAKFHNLYTHKASGRTTLNERPAASTRLDRFNVVHGHSGRITSKPNRHGSRHGTSAPAPAKARLSQ